MCYNKRYSDSEKGFFYFSDPILKNNKWFFRYETFFKLFFNL